MKPATKRKPTPLVKYEKVVGTCTVWCAIPLRLISELNRREHHMATWRRKKSQQAFVTRLLPRKPRGVVATELRLVRIGPRRMDDENSASSFKHVQDAIAKWLGVDDGDLSITYEQRQERAYGFEMSVGFREVTR